jgi:two-component system chemotaxis sensor kinase CheA
MSKILEYLVLPPVVTKFEQGYLGRLNRIGVWFFALHVPAFALIAGLNDTGSALAAALTSAALLGPLLASRALSPRGVSVVHGVTAMFMGGLLVHFGQGPMQIEMHFYFFALIAMCAVFGNPIVVVAAAGTVTIHQLSLWLLLPRSVFNYSATWRVVAVHGAFVALDSVAACFVSRSFFDRVIGLESLVQARTRALDSKNRDMRLLLDNVQQGFLTLDARGILARERSAAVDAWFGVPSPALSWFDYLYRVAPEFAERTRLGWEQLTEGVMPTEVSAAQMPSRLILNDAHYRFEYRPIGSKEPHEHYLVILTDVTEEVKRQLAELERGESMLLFERAMLDRSGVASFFEEAGRIVAALTPRCPEDVGLVKRLVHTLKGNAALYGLTSVADHCHAIEDSMLETQSTPSTTLMVELCERWTRLAAYLEVLLGSRADLIEIDARQYDGLESAALAGETGEAMLRRVRGLKLEATAQRLKYFQEQATRIADRLGKTPLVVELEDHDVRLDRHHWAGFWGAFVHAIRNALDHGIESPEARAATGKLAPACLALRTYERHSGLVVEVADNGRGIDWTEVAARAARAGLAAQSQRDLERALFSDGISTAQNVTDISGRGIGMGALLAATHELGGELRVESRANEGTLVRFTVPSSATPDLKHVAPLNQAS